MHLVDWIALGIVGLGALSGLRRGLVVTVFSLGGLAVGATIGSRLAPHLLHGGSFSPYTPLVGLGGAIVGALLAADRRGAGRLVRPQDAQDRAAARPARLDRRPGRGRAARALRRLGRRRGRPAAAEPGSRPAEHAPAGRAVGDPAAAEHDRLAAQRPAVVRARRPVPARSAGSRRPTASIPTRVLAPRAVRAARQSVVRIQYDRLRARGRGQRLVRQASPRGHRRARDRRRARDHGQRARRLSRSSSTGTTTSRSCAFPTLMAPAARRSSTRRTATRSTSSAIPENGPFNVQPGRIGVTADVLVSGNLREVTSLNGLVRQGNSGGPAVNAQGQVESTIFAARGRLARRLRHPGRAGRARARPTRTQKVSTGSC